MGSAARNALTAFLDQLKDSNADAARRAGRQCADENRFVEPIVPAFGSLESGNRKSRPRRRRSTRRRRGVDALIQDFDVDTVIGAQEVTGRDHCDAVIADQIPVRAPGITLPRMFGPSNEPPMIGIIR